jgi:hypothetical protein
MTRDKGRCQMKRLVSSVVLFLFLIGLSACAANQELIVDINKRQIEEAWEVAYERGLAMNYVPQQLDVKRWVVHFYHTDLYPLPVNYHIRMEIVTQEKYDNGEVDQEKFKGMNFPVLYFEGRDEDINEDDVQVLADINKIASFALRCCGVKSKIGGE